jgi:alkanesulfonate monooxygenase SsuD/methylene tetrahydromethanopterin reductase-like flavin-dependent oxidoreductase (luciferase family)
VVELLIVLSLTLGVVVAAVVPWSWLLAVGAVTTGAGLAFGVATGLWYHIALARVLAPLKALTPRWWLRPVPLHERLDEAGRQRVLPWFYAGAAGFFVTVTGMALIALSLAAGIWRAP